MNAFMSIMLAPFVGSFVGLLIERLPAGRQVIVGRSICTSCGTTLGAIDLVPFLSWLMLRGRCRHCGAGVSGFYPLIELAALAVAIWVAAVLPDRLIWAGCILGWALLALAVIDGRHLILCDQLTLPLIPAGLVVASFVDLGKLAEHAIGAAIGFSVFAGAAWIYRRIRRREGLGGGDAKLLAAAGAWISWTGLASVIFLAALTALVWALLRPLVGRRADRHDYLPFGPSLCLATWLVWLYGPLVPG
jgi:leader peptidase (prepilin peptidase) / N-methyltransferase